MKRVILLFLFISNAIYSKEYIHERGRFKFHIMAGWQETIGLLGLPFVFVGPISNGRRPALSVIPTGMQEKYLSIEKLKKNQGFYRSEKKKWANRHGIKNVTFQPSFSVIWPGIREAEVFSNSYLIKNSKVFEISYYIQCNEGLFLMKLMSFSKQQNERMKKYAERFKCD